MIINGNKVTQAYFNNQEVYQIYLGRLALFDKTIPPTNPVINYSTGLLDTTFDIGTGFNNTINSTAIQSDGKILVGGDFTSFNGFTLLGSGHFVRLEPDGSYPTTGNVLSSDGRVNSISIQSDDKVIVGGAFNTVSVHSEPSGGHSVSVFDSNGLAMLNSDLTKDTTFDIGTGFNNSVLTTAIQSDGKILAGGSFTSFNGSTQNRLIRLNPDGTKDTTFDIGTGFDEVVRSTAIQSDGKIIVGGFFTAYNGSTQDRLIRLNTDGTKDTTFDIGTGFGFRIYSTAIQSDGKILVGGDFTSFNGSTQNYLIRLNDDGTKDTTFDIGTGFDNLVYSTAIQTDGKIIVGGGFTTFNGLSQNYLIRLNDDGTKDTTFDIGTGFNNTVWSTAIQSDGKVLAGGDFITYKDITQNRLIRLA